VFFVKILKIDNTICYGKDLIFEKARFYGGTDKKACSPYFFGIYIKI